MTPLLVEEVGKVLDVEGELQRVHHFAYAELVSLCEVEVEVVFEFFVVGKAFEVLTTVATQVGVACNPSLHSGALHVSSVGNA